MPWFTAGPVSNSAWDAPLWYVLVNKTTNSGPKTGLALLVPLILLIPWLTRRRVHWMITTLMAAIATTLSVEAVARVIQVGHGTHVGIGVFVTFAGGALLALEARRSARAR